MEELYHGVNKIKIFASINEKPTFSVISFVPHKSLMLIDKLAHLLGFGFVNT